MRPEPESLVEINLHQIDKAIEDQPTLVYRYGQQLADSKLRFAEAKAAVDVAFAELALDIRKNPQNYGIGKVTDAVVDAAINNDAGYQATVKDKYFAQYEVDQLSALVEALNHRKSCIEAAVKAHGQMYFSVPNTEQESRRAGNDRGTRHETRRPVDRD